MTPKIYIRADGNPKMGLGHVIRSLALAEMLNEDFECHFIIRNHLTTLKTQILEVCKSINELPETKDNDAEARMLTCKYLTGQEIVVLDGYHFKTEYQRIIKNKGSKLVCIDDIHAYHFVADAVINHAPGLKSSDYSVEEYTKVCLGLDYCLLRRPFLEAAVEPRKITSIETIFICFGGADFNNLTLKALQAFSKMENRVKKINVVLGDANIFKEEIEVFSKTFTKVEINLHESLSAKEMVMIMRESDMAIVPASSILYEVLAVKMPVISGYYVDNQVNIYHGFNAFGLIYGVGDFNFFDDYQKSLTDLSHANIPHILNNQSKLLTGNSHQNIVNLFKSISN